jgi:hypothetical protein
LDIAQALANGALVMVDAASSLTSPPSSTTPGWINPSESGHQHHYQLPSWRSSGSRDNLLVDREHVVVYDAHNETLFRQLLKRYVLDDPQEAQRIAVRGTKFALARHRPQHRVETMLRDLVA